MMCQIYHHQNQKSQSLMFPTKTPAETPRETQEMVIRLLLHCYADPTSEPKHVYLREAESLRRDLQGAQ